MPCKGWIGINDNGMVWLLSSEACKGYFQKENRIIT
jgi:hypothetical protein